MKYLIGVILVLVVWIYVSSRAKKSASVSHGVADMAESWFTAQRINRDSIKFNTYTEVGLARNQGATVLIGVGRRDDGDRVGFVLEVLPGNGIVAGELLVPHGIASWHRSAAVTSAQEGRPMIDILLESAAKHREESNIGG